MDEDEFLEYQLYLMDYHKYYMDAYADYILDQLMNAKEQEEKENN